ncbi:sensor histidine kinase [Chitinophagaceae bacterium MMS25-I14]
MRSAVVLLFVLFTMTSQAQMSEHLYHVLPDSLKPADRMHIKLEEISKMLHSSQKLPLDSSGLQELDNICVKASQIYKHDTSREHRVVFLFNVALYWGKRDANNRDSIIRYFDLYDKEVHEDYRGFENVASSAATTEALYYGILKDYPKALYYSKQAMYLLSRPGNHGQIQDSAQLTKAFYTIGSIYSSLGLYDRAHSYMDSAARYTPAVDNEGINIWSFSIRQDLFLQQYSATREARYTDSMTSLLDRNYRPDLGNVNTQSYFRIKAQVSYFKGEYENCIANLDSDRAHTPGMLKADTSDDLLNAYRGLSLLHLGKTEADKILAGIKPDINDDDWSFILKELYLYEKNRGNTAKALKYHEQLMAIDAQQELYHQQGKFIELEDKYNVASRDLQISKLTVQRKQYTIYIFLVSLIALLILLTFMIRSVASRHKMQRMLRHVDELTEMQRFKIEEAANKAEDQERKRIGQELHDDLGATLAGVTQYLRSKAAKETAPEEKAEMQRVIDMLEDSYYKARAKSHEVYYQEKDDHFTEMLENNMLLFFRETGIVLHTNIDNTDMNQLPATVKTTLLYTVREATTNILKHSGAKNVTMDLYSDQGIIYLEISDDGVGLTLRSGKKSLGLVSLRSRVEQLYGKLLLEDLPGKGTALRIQLPVAA